VSTIKERALGQGQRLRGVRAVPLAGRLDLDDEVRFPPRAGPEQDRTRRRTRLLRARRFKRIFASFRVMSVSELRQRHPNPTFAKRWPYAVDAQLDPSTRLRYVSSGPELASVGHGLQERIAHGVSHFEIG
jgi:hypothetical protein